MPLLVGEAHDFVLDARTVARPRPLDLPAEQRRARQVFENDRLRPLVRVGNVADGAVHPRRARRKQRRRLVPALLLQYGIVDGVGMHTRRRAGLEAQQPHARRAQAVGQPAGGNGVVRPRVVGMLADDDAAGQRRAGRQHDRTRRKERAERALHAADAPALDAQARDLTLHERQVRRPLDGALHIRLIGPPVGLLAQRLNRRPFRQVEHAALQHHAVGRAPHFAAQRVDLKDQMSLAAAPDGRVAGHVPHQIERQGEQRRFRPQPRAGQRRLQPRVSRADDRDVVGFRRIRICQLALPPIFM